MSAVLDSMSTMDAEVQGTMKNIVKEGMHANLAVASRKTHGELHTS